MSRVRRRGSLWRLRGREGGELARRRAGLLTLPIALYAALLALAPRAALSFDEAKYVAIGRNVLRGLGPQTDFGEPFLTHSPLWPVILVAPHAVAGIDPLAWGRAVNIVAAAAVVLLTARLAWRIDPAAGVLAGAAIASWPMLFELSRSARLDVPQAALCLLYLEIGWTGAAGRTGRWAIAGGMVLGMAFLVKESSLVIAPAPFVAAYAIGRPLPRVLRSAGVVLLAASVVSAWWFEWVAVRAHRVYAFGLPGTWLGPLALAVLIVGAGLYLMPWVVRARATGAGVGPPYTTRIALGLVVSAIWITVLGVGFAHSSVLASEPLLNPGQIERYARSWRPDLLTTAMFSVGVVPALILVRRRNHAVALPFAAAACSASWVMLVIATGEPPRDLIAQVAFVDVLAAGGWVLVTRSLVARAEKGAAPRRERSALAPALVATGVVLGTILGGVNVARAIRSEAPNAEAASSAVATAAIDEWIRANVPAGRTVAFGAVQGEEAALGLDGQYRLVSLAPELAGFNARATYGLAAADGDQVADWIAVDRHPREDAFYALSATTLRKALVADGSSYVVYVTGLPTSAPSVNAVLAATPGVHLVKEWRSPYSHASLVVDIYAVDAPSVQVPTDHLYLPAEALNALVDRMRKSRDTASNARALETRVVLAPPSASDAAALQRLKQLAGN